MKMEKSKESQSFSEKEEFSCNVCKKSCFSKNSLKKHMRSHSDRRFDCSICYASFRTTSCLKSHLKTHTGEKPYSCKLCDARFAHKGNLGYHMITHTKEKAYTCKVCRKSFVRNSVLTKHMKSHTGEKVHCCAQCKALFKTKWELQIHVNFVHLNYKHKKASELHKPFSCQVCGKSFSYKCRLKDHTAVHTELHCKLCKQNFDSKLELTLHFKKFHNIEILFHCNICGKCFNLKSALKKHLRGVHCGEKNFSCSVCQKQFSRKESVWTHIRKSDCGKIRNLCVDVRNIGLSYNDQMKDTTVILNEFQTDNIENIAEDTAGQEIFDDSRIKIKRLCVDIRNVGLSYQDQMEDTTVNLIGYKSDYIENDIEDLIEQETLADLKLIENTNRNYSFLDSNESLGAHSSGNVYGNVYTPDPSPDIDIYENKVEVKDSL